MRGTFARLYPCFHLGLIPHNVAFGQIQATWKLAAAIHFVDCRVDLDCPNNAQY